jgi:chromosome segregation ATPase
MLIVSMKEEKKQLFREIKDLNHEVLEQEEEQRSAKDVLKRAKEELEKVMQSKKNILIHLQKALLKQEEKNKILVSVREAEHDRSEENLKKTAELIGMEKEIQKVNRLSALWNKNLENLRMEMNQLERSKDRLTDKMDKLINEGDMLRKATHSTEDQIKEINDDLSKFFF